MTISDEMEQVLLEYFAQDDGENREFQSLTTIFERVIRPSGWRESHFNDVSGIDDKSSLKTILDQMVIDGLLQKDWAEGGYDPTYRATEEGVYESVLGFDGYVPSRPSIVPIEFDPETWTGPRAVFLDAAAWRQIQKTAIELQIRCRTTNYRSEADRQNIQALADALVSLCQMAEPELALIDMITANPKFKVYAALAIFVATIRGALGI